MKVLLGGLLLQMSREGYDLQRQGYTKTQKLVVSLLQKKVGDSFSELSAVDASHLGRRRRWQ